MNIRPLCVDFFILVNYIIDFFHMIWYFSFHFYCTIPLQWLTFVVLILTLGYLHPLCCLSYLKLYSFVGGIWLLRLIFRFFFLRHQNNFQKPCSCCSRHEIWVSSIFHGVRSTIVQIAPSWLAFSIVSTLSTLYGWLLTKFTVAMSIMSVTFKFYQI